MARSFGAWLVLGSMGAVALGACGSSSGGPAGNTSSTTGAGGSSPGDGSTCLPKSCADLGATCGATTDACGHALECGTCAAPSTCAANRCSVSGKWTVVTSYDSILVSLFDVWGTGTTFFSVGSFGQLWINRLGDWEDLSYPTNSAFFGVFGTKFNDVWAGGSSGLLVHFDGSVWTRVPASDGSDIDAVWADGAGKVWALTGGIGTNLARVWDGQKWTETNVLVAQGQLQSLWGSAPNDLWAVDDSGGILHWDGAAWSVAPSPSVSSLNRIWGRSATDVWAVGTSTLLHYDGRSWQEEAGSPIGAMSDVWEADDGTVWIVGEGGGIWKGRAGGSFTPSPSGTTSSLFAIWGASPTDIWAVGEGSITLHYGPGAESDGGTDGPACSPYGYGCIETPCCPGLRCIVLNRNARVCSD